MIDEKEIYSAAFNYQAEENGAPKSEEAFMNGAKWMQKRFIEQLWHSPTIVPENYKDIILISQKGLVHQWYFNPKIDWCEDTKNYNIERWCYIDDILPKSKEE